MAHTVAEHLVDTLARAGVRQIYGVVGDSLNPVTDALRRNGTIKWIDVRHEESGGFAAGAEAQLTGQLAVCAGSCGPGNLHLINGLFDAHRSMAPVLAIAAHIPSSEIGKETHPDQLFRESPPIGGGTGGASCNPSCGIPVALLNGIEIDKRVRQRGAMGSFARRNGRVGLHDSCSAVRGPVTPGRPNWHRASQKRETCCAKLGALTRTGLWLLALGIVDMTDHVVLSKTPGEPVLDYFRMHKEATLPRVGGEGQSRDGGGKRVVNEQPSVVYLARHGETAWCLSG
jgi:hypothetical protein